MGFPSNISVPFYCQTKRAFTGELVATFSGKDTDTRVVWSLVPPGSCLRTPPSQLTGSIYPVAKVHMQLWKQRYKCSIWAAEEVQRRPTAPQANSHHLVKHTKACLLFCFIKEFFTALKKTLEENNYLLYTFKLLAPTIKTKFLNMLMCTENPKIWP